MSDHTGALGSSMGDKSKKLGNKTLPSQSGLVLSGGQETPAPSIVETDPVFLAWDKSTGISVDASQVSGLGDYQEKLENWEFIEDGNDLLLTRDGEPITRIDDEGSVHTGGIIFETSLVRNAELDNTLNTTLGSPLVITEKNSNVLTIPNIPDYDKLDVSGWAAMLCDEDKTSTSDPVASGDYLHKYFCTVDRSAKTLTFDIGDSLAAWEVGDSLVLYNPFINYTFVGDQTSAPIVSSAGAPAWRVGYSTTVSNACGMYRHSDGRFMVLFTGRSAVPKTAVGYVYSTDMISWTIGNSDLPVLEPTAIANCDHLMPCGPIHRLDDGTDRLYCLLSHPRNTDNHGILRIMYFDEDLTTFTFSDPLLPETVAYGNYGGSVLKIDDYYHLIYSTQEATLTDRTIRAAKSLTLEGPYNSYYQVIVTPDSTNDGVTWSNNLDAPVAFDDGVKIWGLFGGTSRWSPSGTKGNRQYNLMTYDKTDGEWTVDKRGPVIIDPFYYQDLDGTYTWAGDHSGGYPAVFVDGGKAYLGQAMKGTAYQFALMELNYRGGSVSNFVPYTGATRPLDLGTQPLVTTGTVTASNLTGTNTGDEDLSGLVPYTGATDDVDLGAHTLTAPKVTVEDAPVDGTDATNKAYVDAVVASGITWKEAVLDILTPLPGGAGAGDRYIDSSDDSINEWNGASWDSTAASAGDTLVVTPGGTVSAGWYTYSTSWIPISVGMAHNDTTSKQGGSAGEYYHLSATAATNTGYVITTAADITPTGLTASSTGITASSDGTQYAYVVLTWNAISTNTFDHYVIRYKQNGFTYYKYITSRTNTITIGELIPAVTYNFGIASVNKYGSASSYSADINQLMPSDTTAPGDVTAVSATAGVQSIVVLWNAVADKDLSYYRIYRHTADVSGSASLIATCKGTYYIDKTPSYVTYYYWIKAVDTSGNASANFSNSVNAVARKVLSTDTVLAHQGWVQTSVFSVTDYNTVAWGAGTFTSSSGTAYSIGASNTANMAAKTYIYLDTDVSSVAYQITTTAATAVGSNKCLVAIATPDADPAGEASFILLNDASLNIDASSIVAGSITANEIAAGTITATQIDVDTITSLDNLVIGAAQITLDGGVTFMDSWSDVGDVTKIDGGVIATGTVLADSINFTDIASNGSIIATINASAEAGLTISGEKISIDGSTDFNPIGGSGQVLIFPDANTGLQIKDNASNVVFEAIIDGANVGDITIGNYAAGQGIKYDKSAGTTTFQGTVVATAGAVAGWDIVSGVIKHDDASPLNSSGMAYGDYPFYAGNTYANRATAPFRITKDGTLYGNYAYFSNTVQFLGVARFDGRVAFGKTPDAESCLDLSDGTSNGTKPAAMIVPKLTTGERNAISTPAGGMVIYNTTDNQFQGYITGAGWAVFTLT